LIKANCSNVKNILKFINQFGVWYGMLILDPKLVYEKQVQVSSYSYLQYSVKSIAKHYSLVHITINKHNITINI